MKSTDAMQPAGTLQEKWISLIEQATREVFELMLGTQVVRSVEDAQGETNITAMVGLAGGLCGLMALRCSRKTANRMAAKMLGVEPAANGHEVQDAFGEICNMVAGNFKHQLEEVGANCMLSAPTVIAGSDYSLYPAPDSGEGRLTILFEGNPLTITLEIQNASDDHRSKRS